MTDTRYHDAARWSLQDGPRAGWNNRYFIDTEFTDFRTCELISMAIVGENGHEFYGERTDFDPALRGWRLENIAASRDPARHAAYSSPHGGIHHALHDARASAYACSGGT